MNKRVFSGIQPSGSQVHIGNYLGAMRRFVTFAKQQETIVCIVDLHSLTSVESKEQLRSYSMSLAAAYLAIGLDPSSVVIFRQSDVPEVAELAWYLACQFPLGLLERAHSIKDARAKNEVVNSGRMFYPILMAADILLYKSNVIPVGADQKQHVEMARDVAGKFNARFGEIFPLPEPLIDAGTGVIPGLDGRKMSKSYNNYIGLFESTVDLRKKVMRITTDSKSVDEPKDPETCSVFGLFKHFGTADEVQSLAGRYRSGGMGYGEAKEQLFQAMEREIAPLRQSYEALIAEEGHLIRVLTEGAARAREIAQATIYQVRDALGLGPVLR